MTETQKRRNDLREKARRLLMVICIIVIIGCAIVVACEISTRIQTERMNKDIRDLYRHAATGGGGSAFSLFAAACAEEALPDTLPEEELPAIQEDFQDLYAVNPDVTGWLTLGETIDYPVLRRDNAYYLTHNFYRKHDSNGAIFLNELNSIWPRDDVLLIHGHNMKSGAMFGRLMRFSAYEYLREHPIVTFRTLYDAQDVYYVPIAAFNASMVETNNAYFDVAQINFENDEEPHANLNTARSSAAFRSYLEAVRKRSLWTSPVEADENDELLVLITCSYSCEDGRFLLVCRKLRDGETPETVSALFQEVNR